MSFLGAQCWHSDILNSSIVPKAIRHVTIPSESLERGLSACQVPTWVRSFPTEIFPLQSRCSSHQSLWSLYFLWIISPLLLQIVTTMSNSGPCPVTPVTSQLYSSTLVAHHLLWSQLCRYTSVKYDPWSNPYTVLTTPRHLPCLDMSSLCTRYISYLV